MSEYLSKKAVLEWLKKRLDETQFVREAHALAKIVGKIECGRFDADQTEVQRLRAAAIKLHETINSFWQGDCDKADVVAAQSKLCDVLSTTMKGDGNDA